MTFFLAVILLQAIYSGGYEYLHHESKVFGGLGDWTRWSALELVQLSVALLIHPAFMVSLSVTVFMHVSVRWGGRAS